MEINPKRTILVVDDNPANLSVIGDFLMENRFRVMVARSGEAGLRMTHEAHPDLILLDVMLPGMDGFEVCRRLKADEEIRDIPVIFMTGAAKTEDKVKGFGVGGVDYITKPVQLEEVLVRVNTHLRIRALTWELRMAKETLETRVTERTSELAEANARLKAEIAERKRAEEEVYQLNQDLGRRVLERTEELNNANKELEAFAYSISHDLRAPLRHINGFLEMLQEHASAQLDAEGQHYMKRISEATRRMSALIDDLLSFSRMSRNEMSKARVDLNELLQDVIREFKPDTEGRDIHWNITPLPCVMADRAMLRMVFVNLISNALKFTSLRSPAEIEINWKEGAGKELIIFMRDNGVGFDMRYADKLFGVFQRLHHVNEFEGTGIGLANIRQIINRHGGKTWAEGEVGQGATFYFSLPQSARGE
jgi:signal transduction histidine kinase